jgi:hypothetical protein
MIVADSNSIKKIVPYTSQPSLTILIKAIYRFLTASRSSTGEEQKEHIYQDLRSLYQCYPDRDNTGQQSH